MNAFMFAPLSGAREMDMRNRGVADLPLREERSLVNGPEAAYSLYWCTFPSPKHITPSSWCTSRGANENVSVFIKLDRPCIVTGIMLCNPGAGFDHHVRDALVFVGSTKEEVAPEAGRFTSLCRHPSGFVDVNPHHAPEASLLGHIRLPWKKATVRTRTGREPFALVEFTNGVRPGTQCFAFGPPTLARYVRVQLLSQFNPKGFPFEEINFDVNSICVLGTELVAPH